MFGRRLLLWARLLVGVGFMYQGVTRITEMRTIAELFARSGGWQSWPLVGGIRPLELVLWLALLEFFLGVFLFGGLLTRILGVVAIAVVGFQLAAVGLAGGVLNPLLLAGSAAVTALGGGPGTMDSVLGKMQRRSMERAAERARSKV